MFIFMKMRIFCRRYRHLHTVKHAVLHQKIRLWCVRCFHQQLPKLSAVGQPGWPAETRLCWGRTRPQVQNSFCISFYWFLQTIFYRGCIPHTCSLNLSLKPNVQRLGCLLLGFVVNLAYFLKRRDDGVFKILIFDPCLLLFWQYLKQMVCFNVIFN